MSAAMPRPLLGMVRSYREFGAIRFTVFVLAIVLWIGFGLWLREVAVYPARCPGLGVVEAYECSFELPATRGWHESALFVWLWSTPILFILEVSRRLARKPETKGFHSKRRPRD